MSACPMSQAYSSHWQSSQRTILSFNALELEVVYISCELTKIWSYLSENMMQVSSSSMFAVEGDVVRLL